MRLLQPSSNIQLSKKNPDRFLKRACEVVRKGWGQPSIFNADLVVEELVRQGKSLEDARQGGTSGCVETGAFGRESYILTGYFNLPKVLELALNGGVDPRTGRLVGVRTAPAASWAAFDDVLRAFERQLRYLLEVKMRGSNIIERLYATRMPAPFLSLLIDDCIEKGRDYNAGGPRYNTTYIMPVGIGTVTDSLSAIATHVFHERTTSLAELVGVLRTDFDGRETLRQTLWHHTPRYGNDDERADRLLRTVCDLVFACVDGRPNTKDGHYHVNYLSTTCHVYFGSRVGATPDGRRAGEPVSDGISPVQGTDRGGPTAVLRSAAKMDHARTGGTLLNLKFAPDVLEGEAGIDHLSQLVRAYFRLDGHHIQFNVVTARDAAGGAGGAREAPGPDCARGRVQRLLLRSHRGPAGRDHRAHRAQDPVTGTIFRIARFSVHDGPGIRTTVFLKGCPLQCPWCHSPESQPRRPQLAIHDDRCLVCGTCLPTCPEHAIEGGAGGYTTDFGRCRACGACVPCCPSGARELVGRSVTADDVIAEIERDVVFFDESGGGVTFSGGEPLMQPAFLEALLERCRDRRIHATVDTCGLADPAWVARLAPIVGLFLFDLKVVDAARHREVTGVSNTVILQNLQYPGACGPGAAGAVPARAWPHRRRRQCPGRGRVGPVARALPGGPSALPSGRPGEVCEDRSGGADRRRGAADRTRDRGSVSLAGVVRTDCPGGWLTGRRSPR